MTRAGDRDGGVAQEGPPIERRHLDERPGGAVTHLFDGLGWTPPASGGSGYEITGGGSR